MTLALVILSVLLLACWSLAAWGLHALLSLDPAWLDDVAGWIDRVPYREVLDQWVPGWDAALAATLDLMQMLLGWLGTAAPWIAWVVWALGAAALLAVASVIGLLLRLLRRPKPQETAALPA